SSHPGLDVNGDAAVDVADADLAIQRIIAKVQMQYAPYDLSIFAGDQDDYQHVLTDEVPGDVIVLITGGPGFGQFSWFTGVAPFVDRGNEHDEIVGVFGGNLSSSFGSADLLINRVSLLISHEMGHAFGLAHATDPTDNPEAITHYTMTYVSPDYSHDFN